MGGVGEGGSALKLAITAQLVNRIELFLPDVSSVVLSTGGSDVLDLSNWGDGDVVPSTHRDDIPSLCVCLFIHLPTIYIIDTTRALHRVLERLPPIKPGDTFHTHNPALTISWSC